MIGNIKDLFLLIDIVIFYQTTIHSKFMVLWIILYYNMVKIKIIIKGIDIENIFGVHLINKLNTICFCIKIVVSYI